MHGLGNHFMVIDAINQSFQPETAPIALWSDNSTGVGFDQMLVVEPATDKKADFKYRIFNADGSEVSQCGNGARCFARFVRKQKLTRKKIITVETNSGLLKLRMLDADNVRVDMGEPLFQPQQIPFTATQQAAEYGLNINGQMVRFSALSIGNPHIVIQVKDTETAAVDTLGPALESSECFPQQVNVGFMQILDRQNFRLRIYERGVGETRACGSGACAAMVAGNRLGLLDQVVCAKLKGGDLDIEWQGPGSNVMKTGPTAMVYNGEIEYD